MKIPVVKEGLSLIKFFLIFALAGYVLGKFGKIFYLFALCSLLFVLFLAYFFRDPERVITRDENLILSPADGKIMEIGDLDTDPLRQWKVIKIFMSPFDVHIQRAPVSGKVVNTEYKKGKFLPAQKNEASEKNEQNIIEIRGTRHEIRDRISGNQRDLEKSAAICVTVKQVAGIFARRIVCWTKIGDYLTQGEKIGMIILGSQVDLYLPVTALAGSPKNIDLRVKIGDRVKAGLTVLASF